MSESETIPVPEKSKEELFQENPERFEDLKNCLLVVKRDPETQKIMILNQCQSIDEAFITEGYVTDGMAAFRNAVRVKQMETQIIKPKQNGFMNGIRGLKR